MKSWYLDDSCKPDVIYTVGDSRLLLAWWKADHVFVERRDFIVSADTGRGIGTIGCYCAHTWSLPTVDNILLIQLSWNIVYYHTVSYFVSSELTLLITCGLEVRKKVSSWQMWGGKHRLDFFPPTPPCLSYQRRLCCPFFCAVPWQATSKWMGNFPRGCLIFAFLRQNCLFI